MRGWNRTLVVLILAMLAGLSLPAEAAGDLQHWDGTSWTKVRSVERAYHHGTLGFYLNDVAALAQGDVWIVGQVFRRHAPAGAPFTEHFDGVAWTDVSNPALHSPQWSYQVPGWLNGVAAMAPDDIWAVGQWYPRGSARQLVEHWDGTAWARIPQRRVGALSFLYGVGGSGPDDVWALGTHSTENGPYRTLIEHWDGKEWTLMTPLSPTATGGVLGAVSAIGPDDAWAVGLQEADNVYQPLIEHWDGHSWTVVSDGLRARGYAVLSDVVAIASDDVWAVGTHRTKAGIRALIEHWDGQHWTKVSSPPLGRHRSDLYGIGAIPGGGLWAVGDVFRRHQRTFIEHCC